MTTSANITIDGIVIAVTMYHEDRGVRHGRVMRCSPQAITTWPLSPAQIEGLAQSQYQAYHCRRDRADLTWAVGKASDLWMGDRPWFFRAVETEAEAMVLDRAAREEAEDGLV